MQYASGFEGGFGGASQFAAGGFMTSSTDANAGGPRKNFSSGAPETLRSMVVAQMRQAQADDQDQPIYDGHAVKNVTIVGILRSKEVTATNLVLQVWDGTGTIEVKKYMETESQAFADRMAMLQEGKYVRVYGLFKHSIEGQGAPPHIFAFEVRPVEDHNEVVYHNLDVIFQHQYLTKGQTGGAGLAAGGMGAMGALASQPPPAAVVAGAGSETTYDAVMRFLQGRLDLDTTLQEIVQALPTHSEANIRQALERAMNEGHAYTTANEHTFKYI